MAEKEKKKEWNSSDIRYYNSVKRIQKQLRKGSWTYLCRHPEIRAIIRVIIHQAVNKNPDNVYQFVADFFNCCNTPILVSMINEQLKRVKDQLKKGRWSEFDGDMFFTESSTESTHSLLSKASTTNNANCVLAYGFVLKESDECDP